MKVHSRDNLKSVVDKYEEALDGEALAMASSLSGPVTKAKRLIATFRDELSKASPRPEILREVGRSIRTVSEEITAHVLAPKIEAAASELWSLLEDMIESGLECV